MQRLVEGVKRFQTEVVPTRLEQFKKLAEKQTPEALFITCSDSRIVPDLITQTEPGDLFIIRNAGNIVPAYGENHGGVSATIEYAVAALDIRHIIICGHTSCGAMQALLHPEKLHDLPTVERWLGHAESARRTIAENMAHLPESEKLQHLIEENVLAQLDNLRTHPSVAARLARNELSLYAWVYHIENGNVRAYDRDAGDFVQLSGAANIPNATPPARRSLQMTA